MTKTFVVPLKVLMALEMVKEDRWNGKLLFTCKHGGVRDAELIPIQSKPVSILSKMDEKDKNIMVTVDI